VIPWGLLHVCLVACSTSPDGIAPPLLRTQEIHRTAAADPGEDPTFYNIHSAHLIGPDSVAVFDSGDLGIKVCSLSGEMDRSYGRKGSGPGEFLHFIKTYADENRQAYAIDLNNWRITRTDLDRGTSEVHTLHPELQTASGQFPVALGRDGLSVWYVSEPVRDPGHPTGQTWEYDLVVVPFNQLSLDTIASRRSGYRNQLVSWEGGKRAFGAPFGPNIAGTLSGGSLFVCFFYPGFQLTEYPLDGEEALTRYHYDVPSVPLTDAELESIYGSDTYRRLEGRALFPERKALIETVWGSDTAGRLWVGRYPFSFLEDPPDDGWFHYDVVDTTGDQILGGVRLQGRLFGVKGDRVFAYSNRLANQGVLLEYQVADLRGGGALP